MQTLEVGFESAPSPAPEEFDFNAFEAEFQNMPDFGLDDFDFNAAFQESVTNVVTNEELLLEEKIKRIDVIMAEAKSSLYQEFVDFNALAATAAAQMEHLCGGDDEHQAAKQSDAASQFAKEDDHEHHNHDHEDEHYKNKHKDKKKKRRSGWLSLLFTKDA